MRVQWVGYIILAFTSLNANDRYDFDDDDEYGEKSGKLM